MPALHFALLFIILISSCQNQNRKIIEFYADGKPKFVYVFSKKSDVYRDKLINGKELGYDSLGNLIREIDYVNGKLNGKEMIYYPNGHIKSITTVRNDSAYGFEYEFTQEGDTSKAFVHYGFSINGIFYKKWLPNGIVLTGNYGDSNRSFVIWKWINKQGKEIKSLIDKGNNETFVAPE